MYDSWDKAQINDPCTEVLQMENHSKEEDKDIQASREYQSFENQNTANIKNQQKLTLMSQRKKERRHLKI